MQTSDSSDREGVPVFTLPPPGSGTSKKNSRSNSNEVSKSIAASNNNNNNNNNSNNNRKTTTPTTETTTAKSSADADDVKNAGLVGVGVGVGGKTSATLDQLSIVADNLETYQGRDTLIALLHYLALILSDVCKYFRWGRKQKLSAKFVNMFVQLNSCRVMLRLFDDFSAIREYYRWNKSSAIKKNVHPYVKFVTATNLICFVLYNPCEHLAWLGELNIIDVDDQMWYFWTNCAWAGGLFTSVLINLRLVYLYYKQEKTKAKREDDPKHDSSEIISRSEMRQATLVSVRDFLDWCIAVQFMPAGFLWSAQLYHYQIGLIGVASSLCRSHTYIFNKQ